MINDLFSPHDDPIVQAIGYQGRYPAQLDGSGRGFEISLPDGQLYYAPQFLSSRIADRCLDVLLANDRYAWRETDWINVPDLDQINWHLIDWQRRPITMYGKTYHPKRLLAWHGDVDYAYSGVNHRAATWNAPLDWLRGQIEQVCAARFNSVLLNWYRSGQDQMGWHSDNEAELGQQPVIASLSLGAARRFVLRRTDDHAHKVEFLLPHGALLIMSGTTQQYWQHSVPKMAKVSDSRINLTFRYTHPR
jgi:alkylated DNA repair dioxygenase AlkB